MVERPATTVRASGRELQPSRLVRSLPNLLSAGRLGLAALLPVAPERWWAAMIVAAAASDGVDGWIARRAGATSWYGGLLDAVADKAFQLTALAVVVLEGLIAPWKLGPLLARDAAVLTIAAVAALCREWTAFRRMPSRACGKATTVAVFALLLVVLLGSPDGRVADALFLVAAVASAAAAVDYALAFARELRARRARA